MDNVFQELDYSDISAKHVKNDNDKKFSEIDTKRRGGIFKLLISFLLFVLLIVFIILVISKSIKVNSIEDEINEKNKEFETLEKEYNNTNDEIKSIELKNNSKKKEIEEQTKELKELKSKIDFINLSSDNLTNCINIISKEIEDLNSKLEEYGYDIEESELQNQLTQLENEIEVLRQSPM